jgi:hypothetical protein
VTSTRIGVSLIAKRPNETVPLVPLVVHTVGCIRVCSRNVHREVSPMKNVWRWAFLGLTALVILMELFASFDGSANTDPWTELIVTYIPAEIAFAAIGALCLWLIVHFGLRYWRKRHAHNQQRLEDHTGSHQRSSGDPLNPR